MRNSRQKFSFLSSPHDTINHVCSYKHHFTYRPVQIKNGKLPEWSISIKTLIKNVSYVSSELTSTRIFFAAAYSCNWPRLLQPCRLSRPATRRPIFHVLWLFLRALNLLLSVNDASCSLVLVLGPFSVSRSRLIGSTSSRYPASLNSLARSFPLSLKCVLLPNHASEEGGLAFLNRCISYVLQWWMMQQNESRKASTSNIRYQPGDSASDPSIMP